MLSSPMPPMSKSVEKRSQPTPPTSSRSAKFLYVVVVVLAIALLVAHSFKWDKVAVDTTSLGLLALILLIPLAPRIRRLSAGGFEAEIGPKDAQQLQASASDLPGAEP